MSTLRSVSKLVVGTAVIAFTIWVLWAPDYSKTALESFVNPISLGLSLAYPILFVLTEFERPEAITTLSRKKLRTEYKVLNQSVSRRENSLLVSGSIFVTAALLLLGQSTMVSSQPVLMKLSIFTSWTIYSTWLFLLQLTAGRLTDLTYRRLKDIEKLLQLEIHTFLGSKRDPVRKWIWLWLLDALLLGGGLLWGLNLWWYKYSIPIQVSIMAALTFKR